MAETVLLTDHTAIRDWAAARSGFPAIIDISPQGGTQPMLRLVFDQRAYQDQDRAERPVNAGESSREPCTAWPNVAPRSGHSEKSWRRRFLLGS